MSALPRADPRERIIPGIEDGHGNPVPMPYDPHRWEAEWYDQVLRHRARVQRDTAGTDPASLDARALCRAYCRQPGANGTLYLLNTFSWILEPRNATVEDKRLEFITWPRQAELLDAYDRALATPPPDPEANLAVIKSRDVGGTWIDVAHKAKNWRFQRMWHAMVISADFDLAANWNDPKAYFYKLKFLISGWPEWLLPAGFGGFVPRSPHAKEGILINPEGDCTITASTTTEDAGKGNRLAEATLEEAGTLESFDEIFNSMTQVTGHQQIISSARVEHGMGLYNLVHGKDGYTAPRTFIFRWSDVPGRDEDWYRRMKQTMKTELFAREVDIDWLAGTGEMAFPAIQRVEPGHYPYQPAWQTYGSIDDGYDQDTAFSLWQTDLAKGRLRCIAAYANHKVPISYYGEVMTGQLSGKFAVDETARRLAAWIRDQGLVYKIIWYGDRHGDNTELSSGKSPFQVLAEDFGIYVNINANPEENNLKFRLDLVNDHVHLLDFDTEHGAPQVLEALKESRHPRRSDRAQPVSETKGVIHHGTESHYRTTLDYLLLNLRWQFKDRQPAPPPTRVGMGGFDPQRLAGRRFRREREPALWTR